MTDGSPDPSFDHRALLYAWEEEFIAGALPFVREGLSRDEPVMVVATARKCDRLAQALNGDGPGTVEFVDMGELGRNPARILPAWQEFVDRHPGSSIRGVGEPAWGDRSSDALIECHRHESLLNLAFGESAGFSLLCPYDISDLPSDVVDRARRTHPSLIEDGQPRTSPIYLSPRASAGPFAGQLRPPPAEAVTSEFSRELDLSRLRSLVSERALAAGLAPARAADLALAVSELAANSLHHGGSRGTLAIWEEGDAVVCEVRDTGWITEPLAGRRRPEPIALRGRGLWVVNHLCDLVQIRSSSVGTAVRVRVEADAERRDARRGEPPHAA